MLLWGITIACAVAIGVAAGAIILTWRANRRRHLRHVASGIRAAEAHLAGAARDHAARCHRPLAR
jgi:hypothetical protein